MRLRLSEVIHVSGASAPFSFELDLSEMEFYDRRPATRPIAVEGFVKNTAGILTLNAQICTILENTCDRCMKGFQKPICFPLVVNLAHELENEENDEIVLLDGDYIDVGELARSAFILEMDTKSLCMEDCKGLCAGCGANLNEGACACRPDVDPRFSVLQQLLDD